MADEDDSQGADAAEAFEAMRGELALLRRAVEGLAAERGAIDIPDYTETLGALQQGVNTAAGRINAIGQILAKAPALALTPEDMAQRIAAAGSAARREDQAALAKAGEDKARVMAELRAIAGSAWTRVDQRNRQLWFGLGGVVAGVLVWAIMPGLVRPRGRACELAMARAHGGADARLAPLGSGAAHDAECRPSAVPRDRRCRQDRNGQSRGDRGV